MGTLLSGLTVQGSDREHYQVIGTTLAPPQVYYFVSVDINRVRYDSRREGASQMAAPEIRTAEYDCILGITDYAVIQEVDSEPYRDMHRSFRKFTDRIIALLEDRNNRWLVAPGGVAKYELKRTGRESDRAVEKNNMSGTVIDQEQEYSLLHSQVTFTLVDNCHDTGLLY